MVSSSTTMKVLTVVINIVLAVSVTAVVLDVSRQDLGGHDHEQVFRIFRPFHMDDIELKLSMIKSKSRFY